MENKIPRRSKSDEKHKPNVVQRMQKIRVCDSIADASYPKPALIPN